MRKEGARDALKVAAVLNGDNCPACGLPVIAMDRDYFFRDHRDGPTLRVTYHHKRRERCEVGYTANREEEAGRIEARIHEVWARENKYPLNRYHYTAAKTKSEPVATQHCHPPDQTCRKNKKSSCFPLY